METDRTILIKPERKDYDDLLDLHTHEEVCRYLGGPVIEKEFDSYFEKILSAISPDSYWIIRRKEDDVFIGFLSIDLHHDRQHYELSYQFLPEFWGQGYAYEACQRVLQYAFDELELEAVISETQKKNVRSIELLERLGMTLESTLERFGEEQVIYCIRR